MEFIHVTRPKSSINNINTFILSQSEGFFITTSRPQLFNQNSITGFVLPVEGGTSGSELNREMVGLNRCLVAEPFVCFLPSGYCIEDIGSADYCHACRARQNDACWDKQPCVT